MIIKLKKETIFDSIEELNRKNPDVDILSKCRTDEHVQMRACVANVLFKEYKMGKSSIGRILNRDHTTIINLIKNEDVYKKYFSNYMFYYDFFTKSLRRNMVRGKVYRIKTIVKSVN